MSLRHGFSVRDLPFVVSMEAEEEFGGVRNMAEFCAGIFDNTGMKADFCPKSPLEF